MKQHFSCPHTVILYTTEHLQCKGKTRNLEVIYARYQANNLIHQTRVSSSLDLQCVIDVKIKIATKQINEKWKSINDTKLQKKSAIYD